MGYIYSHLSHPVVQRYQSEQAAIQRLIDQGKQGWYAFIEEGQVVGIDQSYMALAHRYWDRPGFERKSIFRVLGPIT